LALVLTMMVASAVPASAAGSVKVTVVPATALDPALWSISFTVEAALLMANNDYIDVYLPVGMTAVGITTGVGWSATAGETGRGLAVAMAQPPVTPPLLKTDITPRQVRFDFPFDIPAGAWVAIYFEDIINPVSCFHTVTIVQSNCCTTVSPQFTIWTVKMDLEKGKNLISLPAYPEDTAIEVVLARLFAEVARTAAFVAPNTPFAFSVWYWDSVAQAWVIYASDTSFSSLTTMEAGKAYWIKVNYAFSFFFKGTPYPECQGPPQKWCYPKSWSMIGPAIQTAAVNASTYLWDAMLVGYPNTYAVTKILSFNATTQSYFDTTWTPGPRDVPAWQGVVPPGGTPPYQDVELLQGRGYFMSFLGEACIIPPVGP